MWIAIIGLGTLCIIELFAIINLLHKYELLEDANDESIDRTEYLEDNIRLISDRLTITDERLKEIDQRGSFEADDEVGFFFEEVKQLQELLKDVIPS